MTIDESIEVLTCHKLHWEHLLEYGICDAHEGKETISALTIALASLEAWEKVKQEIEHKKFRTMEVQISDAHLGFNGGLKCALAIIDRHLQEVKK